MNQINQPSNFDSKWRASNFGREDMGFEGIGASVCARKIDVSSPARAVRRRIKVPGMTHAHFVRSPHAHAKVKGIDRAPR